MSTINERIRELRQALEYSKTTFARIIGVSQPNITQLERGDFAPSKRLLFALESVFPELNIKWLVGKEESPMFLLKKDQSPTINPEYGKNIVNPPKNADLKKYQQKGVTEKTSINDQKERKMEEPVAAGKPAAAGKYETFNKTATDPISFKKTQSNEQFAPVNAEQAINGGQATTATPLLPTDPQAMLLRFMEENFAANQQFVAFSRQCINDSFNLQNNILQQQQVLLRQHLELIDQLIFRREANPVPQLSETQTEKSGAPVKSVEENTTEAAAADKFAAAASVAGYKIKKQSVLSEEQLKNGKSDFLHTNNKADPIINS